MVKEADVVSDQRHCPKLRINFDANHGDRIVQKHGEEGMESVGGKAVQTDRNIRDDGGHVQE